MGGTASLIILTVAGLEGRTVPSESYAATTRHSLFADRESYPPMCFLGSHLRRLLLEASLVLI